MPYKANFQDNPIHNRNVLYGLVSILACLIFFLLFHFTQKEFFSFFPIYGLSFLVYVWICRFDFSVRHLFIFAIIVRLGLVFLFPTLSDDIYRFYWDGTLSISHVSPYGILPTEVLDYHIPQLDQNLFLQLNSPEYYTIYPPINQLYFAIAAYTGNIYSAAIVMKLLVLITEMIGLHFMIKIMRNEAYNISNATWYILNPLVIIEGIGNLHFEVVMISWMTIFLYFFLKNKILFASFWMAISIGVKLLPLMLLPYFIFHLQGTKRRNFFGSLLVFLAVIFMPLILGFQPSTFLKSIDLYFRKFEFNASFYFILRYIGHQISGYNLIKYIGPLLAILTLAWNVYQANKLGKDRSILFFTYCLTVWSVYLFLATTVHPWYIISLVFLCTLTKWTYALNWSFLVFISYIHYSENAYMHHYWWIGFEYLVLFAWIVRELYADKFSKVDNIA